MNTAPLTPPVPVVSRTDNNAPVWALAVTSFFPPAVRERAQHHARHLPLVLILLVQIIGSARLRNTAFRDEGLYVWTGYRVWDSWFGDAVLYDKPETYFSGAHVVYPPLAAALDMVGGLYAVRAFSLVCMLAATVAIFSFTSRLFTRRAAYVAAFAFAVAGPTMHLGWFATFDAMAISLVAVATALGVRAVQRGSLLRWFAVVGSLLALAIVTKYAAAMFVPASLAVIALTPARRTFSVKFAVMSGLVTFIIITSLALTVGRTAVEGFLFSTGDRTAMQAATPFDILADTWQYAGLWYVIALMGFVCALVSLHRYLLPLVLAGAMIAPAAYQAYIGEGVSLSKHLDFGLVFAAPLIGVAFAVLTTLWQRMLGVIAAVALVLNGLATSHFLYGEWSNVEALTDTMAYSFDAAPYIRTLGDVYEPVRYAFRDSTEYWQWDTTDSIYYQPESGDPIRGIDGAKAGLKDGYWQLVYFNQSTGISQELTPLMEAYGYEETNRVTLTNNRGEDVYTVWQRWDGTRS